MYGFSNFISLISPHRQPTGIRTCVDSLIRVASQRSNQFGRRVRPVGEKLTGQMDCHTSFIDAAFLLPTNCEPNRNIKHLNNGNGEMELTITDPRQSLTITIPLLALFTKATVSESGCNMQFCSISVNYNRLLSINFWRIYKISNIWIDVCSENFIPKQTTKILSKISGIW